MTKTVVLTFVDIAHSESALALLKDVKLKFPDYEIHVAYVMPFGFYSYVEPFVSKESQEASANRARDELAQLIEREGSGADIVSHVLRGGIGEQALLLADKLSPEIIALNATRQDSAHITLGTQAAQIARHAKCSVYLSRA